jgi:hypothetical protein
MLKTLANSLIILSAIFFAVAALAIGTPSMDSYSIDIWPGIPGPNTQVIGKATSNSFDINAAYISWELDGRIIDKGYGKKTVKFMTGKAGTKNKLKVSITPNGGTEQTETINLNINDIDMLWHADTYVPVYYIGKSLMPKKSQVTVTAMPHMYKNGALLPANALLYDWRIGERHFPEQSGFNKQSFTFNADGIIRRSQIVEVVVTSQDGQVEATNAIPIMPRGTETIFYETKPLEGVVSRHATTNFSALSGGIKQFIAVPFYFSTKDPGTLTYEWSANGAPETEQTQRNYLFNFQSSPEVTGLVNVSLAISNSKSYFQQDAGGFNIEVK